MGRSLLLCVCCFFAWLLAGCESTVVDGTGGGGTTSGATTSSTATTASGTASSTGAGMAVCLEPCERCAFDHAWSKGFHNADGGGASSVAPAPDGGVFVAGRLQGPMDLGTGPLNEGAFLARFDPSGALVWVEGYPNAYIQTVTAVTQGRVLLAGSLSSGTVDFGGGSLGGVAFLAELDADGNHIWSRSFDGDGYVTIRNAVVHPDGDVVVALSLIGTIDLGSGPVTSDQFSDNPLLAKLSTAGELRWMVIASTIGVGDAMDVAPDGTIAWAMDAGSELDGPFDVLGATVVGPGTHLVSLDAAGEPLWQRTLTVDYSLLASDVAFGPDGSVVLTGVVDGFANFGMGTSEQNGAFVAKYASSGEPLWSFAVTDPTDPRALSNWGYRIDVDDCGEILLLALVRNADFGGGPIGTRVGNFGQAGELGLVRLGPNGEHRASASYGLRGAFTVGELAITSAGHVVIAGGADVFDGVIDFGGGPVHTDEDGTVFVAELIP